MAHRELPSALDLAVSDVLTRAGLGPESVVLVRRLAVKVGEGRDGAELAAAWAASIGSALSRALSEAAPGGGTWTDQIAIFPDRMSAEWAAVVAAAEGRPPWWWAQINQDQILPACDLVAGWIDQDPGRAVHRIRALAERLGREFGRALPGHGRLAERLTRGRALAGEALSGAQARAGAWSGSEEELLEAMAVAGHEAGTSPRVGEHGGLQIQNNNGVTDVIPSHAWAETTRAALRAASPSTRLLLLLCLGWRQAPALSAMGALERAVRDEQARRASTPDDGDNTGVTLRYATPSTGSSPPPPPTLLRSRPTEPLNPALGVPVSAGGLLFLIRWSASDPLVLDTALPLLPARLHAFGTLVMNQALAGRTPGERRRALEENEPVLRIFAGLDPEAPGAPPVDPDPCPVMAALDRLLGALPEELDLATLVLRPGRLSWAEGRADLHLSMRQVSVSLRVGGWDLDPGYVPWLGRTVRFHYHEDPP